MHKFEQTVFL